jgi:hypothetical protein
MWTHLSNQILFSHVSFGNAEPGRQSKMVHSRNQQNAKMKKALTDFNVNDLDAIIHKKDGGS